MINKLRNEIKNAMKEKDITKRDVLKLVLAKSQAIAKENKIEEITNDMIIQAGNSEIKQINQALEVTPEGTEFYIENISKKQVLVDFLPKQLSEEEIMVKVKEYLSEMEDTSNKGLVMKTLMPKFKGIADGKLVNKAIMTCLNK